MSGIKVLHLLEVEKEAFYFTNLADFTNKNEVEFVYVNFASECDFSKSIESRNLRVYSLNGFQKGKVPQYIRRLTEIFEKENPDIVHTHLFNPTTLGLWLAKRQKRQTVLTRHHSDALHLLPSKLKRNFYGWLEKQNNRRADHIIAPSKMVYECIVEWEGTPSEKVSIIPYGQTFERFSKVTPEVVKQKREELGMNEQVSLVCVSRLFEAKGHKYLFEAFAPLIKHGLKAKLYLVGTGEYRSILEKTLKELNIEDSVIFLGWRDDILPIIASSDIIVHPSLEDALSQSLIESLMLERPIVATDISGASDTLNNGKYGKLVPPKDSGSFGVALKETIENLDAARSKAAQGKDYLLEYMNAQRVTNEYVEIYRKVLSS